MPAPRASNPAPQIVIEELKMSRQPEIEKNVSEVKTHPKFRRPMSSELSALKNERNMVRTVGMTSETVMKIKAGPTKIHVRAF